MPDVNQIAQLLAARSGPPTATPMPAGAPPPGAGAAPPGGAPGAPPPMGGMNPMAMLAQRGAGGAVPDQVMQFLTFMAGMGFPEFVRSIEKMRGPKESHKKQTPMQQDAAMSGGMAPPPQIAQMLAQRAAMAKAMPALGAGGAMAAPMGGGAGIPSGTPF